MDFWGFGHNKGLWILGDESCKGLAGILEVK